MKAICCALTLFAICDADLALAKPVNKPLVLMTDFGNRDGAVSEVKGVAYGVSQDILISDLSHEIEPANIFEGAYRLYQTAPYWPKNSVFVGVVDPGVGTSRLSIAVKTKTGHVFIGPNNGLFSLITEVEGIDEIRTIDESKNRLPGSGESNTFFGRDVFGYTGARLAAGKITFAQIGPKIANEKFIELKWQKPYFDGNKLIGSIPILDVNYGNVWSDIPKSMFDKFGAKYGDIIHVKISHLGQVIKEIDAPFVATFGDVPQGEPLVYINSLINVSIALNIDDFAKKYGISSGEGWNIEFSKK